MHFHFAPHVRKMKNKFLAICCPLFFIGCHSTTLKHKAVEEFPVTLPVTIDTSYTVDYVAEISSVQNIELRARIKGYIEKVYTDEGKFVKEGQLLFSISSQEYNEEVLKANANLKSAIADAKTAELDYKNVQILVEKNIVSTSELEMAKARLQALQAKIEAARAHEASARLRLGFTQIKAPFSGVIDRIPNKAGSLVDEGTLLTTLSDNREVFAYFNVSEKEYLDFTANASDETKFREVSLILANNTKHPYRGRIETIEGEFNQSTGSIAFRARFPNPHKVLKHGASGKVHILRHLEGVTVIPQKSTFEIQDRTYVFAVDSNNTVHMKQITTAQRLPHLYVVQSGLHRSERFIYEGIQDLRDSMKIIPRITSPLTIINTLAQANNAEAIQ
jgi:RND family efflux transporter MFP subunit